MSHDERVPSGFDGTTRLFPLPNVVLFPRVVLPLHIFEPRYRQMTADALETDKLITMVLLKPGPEGEAERCPAIHSVACLGKIIADQRLEDGRYHILLRGLSRVSISSELNTGKLYRSARVELRADTGLVSADGSRAFLEQLSPVAARWFAALGLASEPLAKTLQGDFPVGVFVDILGFALPLLTEFKQQLLQEFDIKRRADCLLQYLQTHEPPKGMVSGLHKFPPQFSTN